MARANPSEPTDATQGSHHTPDIEAPSQQAISAFYDGMRPFWHPVLWESDLAEGKLLRVELLGVGIVLARLDGKVAALRDLCRHFQARLSLGEVVGLEGGEAVMCPYHGWAYGADGICKRIPQLAAGRQIPPAARVDAYRVSIRYGLIWVCMAEPVYDIPDYPERDDPAFRTVTIVEKEASKTSSIRMIMGTLDDTHFPWVHEGILGNRDAPAPPDHTVWRDGRYLMLQYDTDQPPSLVSTDMSAGGGLSKGSVKIRYTDHVGMPNVIRLVKDSDAGRYVVWLATCPNSYNRTTNFWAFSRNYDLSPASDAAYESLSAHVRSQDKPIVESQRPWLLPPFWTGLEMPLTPGDKPLMAYQKWLEELGIVTRI
ncbi:MAG: aromatic ring-hydroxylating dioxygenase subunit alpha [Tabrizicola sp.]|jgi:vanillate O-demethylase monooxygenase subunit|nr:aromatic ring-hydroxylating dioxygenase subunit alpha [Tabrizicola sp.]